MGFENTAQFEKFLFSIMNTVNNFTPSTACNYKYADVALKVALVVCDQLPHRHSRIYRLRLTRAVRLSMSVSLMGTAILELTFLN